MSHEFEISALKMLAISNNSAYTEETKLKVMQEIFGYLYKAANRGETSIDIYWEKILDKKIDSEASRKIYKGIIQEKLNALGYNVTFRKTSSYIFEVSWSKPSTMIGALSLK